MRAASTASEEYIVMLRGDGMAARLATAWTPESLGCRLDHPLLDFYDIQRQARTTLDGTLEICSWLCTDLGSDELVFDDQISNHLSYLGCCARCIVWADGSICKLVRSRRSSGGECSKLLGGKALQGAHVVLVSQDAHLHMEAEMGCVLLEQGYVVIEVVEVVYERTDTVWIVVGKIEVAVLLFLRRHQYRSSEVQMRGNILKGRVHATWSTIEWRVETSLCTFRDLSPQMMVKYDNDVSTWSLVSN